MREYNGHPDGWYCVRDGKHTGPCALRPRFWYHPILWLKDHIHFN